MFHSAHPRTNTRGEKTASPLSHVSEEKRQASREVHVATSATCIPLTVHTTHPKVKRHIRAKSPSQKKGVSAAQSFCVCRLHTTSTLALASRPEHSQSSSKDITPHNPFYSDPPSWQHHQPPIYTLAALPNKNDKHEKPTRTDTTPKYVSFSPTYTAI